MHKHMRSDMITATQQGQTWKCAVKIVNVSKKFGDSNIALQ